MRSACVVVAVSLVLAVSNPAVAQTTLRVGAAKVDVTPAAGELPKNNLGILDRLYARTIVLENGATSAALITLDAGAIPDALWQTVSTQIQKELGIPPPGLPHGPDGGSLDRFAAGGADEEMR